MDIKHIIGAVVGALLAFGLTFLSGKLGVDVKADLCKDQVPVTAPIQAK